MEKVLIALIGSALTIALSTLILYGSRYISLCILRGRDISMGKLLVGAVRSLFTLHRRNQFVIFIVLSIVNIVLSLLVVALYHTALEYLYMMVLIIGLEILFFCDSRYFLLPDIITISMLWLILLMIACHWKEDIELENAILGAAIGYVFPFCINYLYKVLKGRSGLGYGDMKLFACCGCYFGTKLLFAIICISCLSLSIYVAIANVLFKKNLDVIYPLGPHICLSFLSFILIAPLGITDDLLKGYYTILIPFLH
ncbi:prepilin peptidase [Fangia hongkongensis]|uniref:prepilin peptidase n=1 Tax=Fangia hongkongensis TaxID=270495 RepID=UPI000365E604|nr:A24 family peptidase [Fangia hongkongensis]MBK2124961.1 prepilin peptidase [Fangia hongkongensis]